MVPDEFPCGDLDPDEIRVDENDGSEDGDDSVHAELENPWPNWSGLWGSGGGKP